MEKKKKKKERHSLELILVALKDAGKTADVWVYGIAQQTHSELQEIAWIAALFLLNWLPDQQVEMPP